MASPELARLRASLEGKPPNDHDVPIALRRSRYEETAEGFGLPADVITEEISLGGDLKGLSVRTPETRLGRTIIWYHGGAFAFGSPRAYRELCARVGRAAEAEVIIPAYRLAPENPYPAGHDDALQAYLHLRENTENAIALSGDSAGGNLAVATAISARDMGVPLPVAVATVSGWFDMTNSRPSISERDPRDPMIVGSRMDRTVDFFAPGADRHDPRISPIFADLSGLPPMLLMVGSEEVLHDDNVDLAAAARAAGVEAEAEVWPEMIHNWLFFGSSLPEGREGSDRLGAYLGSRLSG